ncbi:MAG: sugar transferase [Sphingomonadales bacterium]|nr:MAG: sugar transferase [Sphingomonadales bacterium]
MDRAAARLFEICAALLVLLLALPLLLATMLAIWLADGGTPIYRAPRVGRGGRDFTMFKLRTMVASADRLGGRFAPDADPRITRVGAWLRRTKIDEIPQFWNVVRGEMAIVGPRPDMRSGVDRYSPEEMRLLDVRPGITGLASLLFFDEGQLLARAGDPAAYHIAVIRPLKSRLGLLQVEGRPAADMRIAGLTALRFVSRDAALAGVARILDAFGAEDDLLALCGPRPQTAILRGVAGTVRG